MALAVVATQWWPAQTAQAAVPGASIVQIVAHQDDDLLFMSPDLSNSIRAGYKVTTVYVTAGEAQRSGTVGENRDAETYAGARQEGIRIAYARMADCNDSCWVKDPADKPYRPLAGGSVVERFTLRTNPSVQVVFLSLPEAADARYLGGNALRQLWTSRDSPSPLTAETLDIDQDDTIPVQHYTGNRLIDTLRGILTGQGATLVRIQDPAPDFRLWGAEEDPNSHDHMDHTSTAWFADAAVESYASITGRRVAVEHYRDYNIAKSPHNLSFSEKTEKWDTFNAYAEKDERIGKKKVENNKEIVVEEPYPQWPSRQYMRNQRSTQAVTADRTGALHAFAVEGGSLYEWVENGSKVWQGPIWQGRPGGPLAAGVTVARNQDGRLEVFGQRADTGVIVSYAQNTLGGWTWNSLGSPNTVLGPDDKLTNPALQVSMPVVASNGDGRLQLFVRNGGGGISSAWQQTPNGGWTDWADLQKSGVQGAPAAFTTQDGRIELFAVTVADANSAVLHWYQPTPNGALVLDPNFPYVSPASGISVGMDPDGRLELFYRQIALADKEGNLADSYTMNLFQFSPGGSWVRASGAVGGKPDQGGSGEPAVVTPGAAVQQRMVVAVRNRGGGVSVSRQGSTGQFGDWSDLGGFIVGVPAAAVDRDGLTDLVALFPDGRLHHNRQRTDGSFSGWTPMGTS
ncbi:PIG-L family deacetylase [Kitasatospora sp. NPDC004240]